MQETGGGLKNPWKRKLHRDEETCSQRERGKHKDHGNGKRSTHGTQSKERMLQDISGHTSIATPECEQHTKFSTSKTPAVHHSSFAARVRIRGSVY